MFVCVDRHSKQTNKIKQSKAKQNENEIKNENEKTTKTTLTMAAAEYIREKIEWKLSDLLAEKLDWYEQNERNTQSEREPIDIGRYLSGPYYYCIARRIRDVSTYAHFTILYTIISISYSFASPVLRGYFRNLKSVKWPNL